MYLILHCDMDMGYNIVYFWGNSIEKLLTDKITGNFITMMQSSPACYVMSSIAASMSG